MNNVSKTRATYNKLTGQIIEDVIGLDDVRKLFEAAENGDVEAQAKIEKAGAADKAPSGFLAVDLGLVDKETKNALLTAQAAERSLLIMEEIEHFYQNQLPELDNIHGDERQVQTYFDNHVKAAETQIPSFKFIGSEGDPQSLVSAQATHQLATEYEYNEKIGMKDQLQNVCMRVPDCEPLGIEFIEGFKAHAAQSYRAAGDVLMKKGYMTAANNMIEVSESISFNAEVAEKHMPSRLAMRLAFNQNALVSQVNMILDPCNERDTPYTSVNEKWLETISKRGQQSLKYA